MMIMMSEVNGSLTRAPSTAGGTQKIAINLSIVFIVSYSDISLCQWKRLLVIYSMKSLLHNLRTLQQKPYKKNSRLLFTTQR